MYVGEDKPAFRIPRPSKKELVEGINKKTVIDYNSTEDFTSISNDKKFIKFSPKKKEHVGDFIVRVSISIDSSKVNTSMTYKIILKVLDLKPPPPPLDTLGERVRFHIMKIT